MSRKVQIVNMEANESERDVIVTNEKGEAQTIRPGRTLDIEVGRGTVIAISGHSLTPKPTPMDDLMSVIQVTDEFTDEQRAALARNVFTDDEIAAMKAGNDPFTINTIKPAAPATPAAPAPSKPKPAAKAKAPKAKK